MPDVAPDTLRLVALGCLVLALGVSGCGGPSYGEWLNSELKIDVKGGSYGKVRLGSGDFQRGDASVRAEVTMTQTPPFDTRQQSSTWNGSITQGDAW